MSPTIRLGPTTVDLDTVRHTRTPRLAIAYAFALLAIALAIVVALAANNQPWPPSGPLLLLAIPLALCMNRFVFFPNEIGVTADAAVIFAAMVAFQHDAQWLGPLVVALLVGPLDAKHWAEHAFVRMAYNSGSMALVTCGGILAFDTVSNALGSSRLASIGAAASAAISYVLLESVFGVSLVTLLGERPRAAVRHQLTLNAIVIPLAVVGAAAGLAAVDDAWWAMFFLLLPAPLVPELLIVVLPRRFGRPHVLAVATGLVALALLISSVVLPNTTARALTGIAGLVCVVLLENPPTRAVPIPPFAAILVVAAIAYDVDVSSVASISIAMACGALYLVISAQRKPGALWGLTVVAFAAPLAGAADVAVFCVGLIVGVVVCAMWGPLPWNSRYIAPFVVRCPRFPRRAALVVLAGAAASLALDTTLTLVAIAIIELEVAMAALAVRLWRFAPRKRAYDIGALIATAMTAVVAVLPLADAGGYAATVVVGLLSAVVISVAWPLSAVGHARARSSEQLDVAHRQ